MSSYAVGPFRLNAEQLLLTLGGMPVALGPKVVETLLALVERPGHVLTKRFLLDRIWPDGFVEEANLSQNIHVLRKTFRRHGCADPIETIPRRGYRLTASVSTTANGAVHAARANLTRRIVAAIAGVACVAASLSLVASHDLGLREAAPGALSDTGARLYQIGRYYWDLRTLDGVQKSMAYFARVVDEDPRDARGYAALADANLTMGDYCYGTHQPAVYFARAREYASQALALDPDSAQAHAALGFLALHREDARAGMAELQRAIALDPSYAAAHEWYGIALLRGGHAHEGQRHLKIAAELDPLSVAAIAWLGSAAYLDRRFGDAIVYSRQALELSPKRTDALVMVGEAYEAQGDLTRAIEAFKRFGAVNPYYRPEAAALLAQAYALAHRRTEARAQLAVARAHASDVDAPDLIAAALAVDDHGVLTDSLRRARTHETWAAIENAVHFGALRGGSLISLSQARSGLDRRRPALI
jgi:DNA-binding winged helix-turn-helix (wHTH) protein/Tfp pilus assembly protein PilF